MTTKRTKPPRSRIYAFAYDYGRAAYHWGTATEAAELGMIDGVEYRRLSDDEQRKLLATRGSGCAGLISARFERRYDELVKQGRYFDSTKIRRE